VGVLLISSWGILLPQHYESPKDVMYYSK